MADTTPVLSFPAFLRNPGLNDRYAHLYGGPLVSQGQEASRQVRVKRFRRDQNEGKRWVRRKDNAHFVGNPHVVAATRKDYILPTPSNKSTFPEPLPPYLPRTAKMPAARFPTRDPASANAGRFSLSMKGMRRELRRAGGKAAALVRGVEAEMLEWLQGGVMLRPNESNARDLVQLQLNLGEGRVIESTGIVEVSRSPLQLVWSIADDAFARYVVHCCARYHEVISFSKGDSNERLTYLLRPNVRKPDFGAATTLETPPFTDADYSSQIDTTEVDSEFVSDRDLVDSDAEELSSDAQAFQTPNHTTNLASIQETSIPSSPQVSPDPSIPREDDQWSVLSGDADAFGDESSSETGQDLLDSVAGLSLEDMQVRTGKDPNETVAQSSLGLIQKVLADGRESLQGLGGFSDHRRPSNLVSRRWTRSASSPSRSPARIRQLAKKRRATRMRAAQKASHASFYDYLFS